jgi:hypothetical protein
VPFSLEMYALRRLTTAAFGTLMCLEPALALAAGFALLGQVPRAWSLAGVALVVAAGIGAVRAGARPAPEDWVTGDEPMTGPQKSYLQTLAREVGRDIDLDALSKAGASRLIDELQAVSGRGRPI